MKIDELPTGRDEDRRWWGAKCPKCGAFSGDTWSQCERRCPLDISPWFDPETSREFKAKAESGD